MKRIASAPRNPFVVAAKFKNAGPHMKSEKAIRRAARIELGRLVSAKTDKQYYPPAEHYPTRKAIAFSRFSCWRDAKKGQVRSSSVGRAGHC